MPRHKRAALRRRVYEVLEEGSIGGYTNRLVTRALVVLIAVNLLSAILESVPALEQQYAMLFAAVELASLVVFTIEYLLRLWVAPEHERDRELPDHRARLNYALSPAGLVDLLSVLPFWLAPVLPGDLRSILVLRVFRFLKLARYSPGMRSLLDALYDERRALFGCMLILFGATIIVASTMHLIERDVQPDKFGTIPEAMWWAIVTLGTIGYGDVVPITPLGRLVASFAIFGGLIMVALPIGIIATAFAEAVHRRDFVVTWSMVARVPLFAGLNAEEIADIMRLLQARTVEAGEVIAHRGEAAHSMYLISEGEVEIELDDGPVRLGKGHFCGEMAVLRRSRRSATIKAVERSHLLVLEAHDFRALLQRRPQIAKRFNAAMRDRVGRELVSVHGDLITEELDDEAERPNASKRAARRNKKAPRGASE